MNYRLPNNTDPVTGTVCDLRVNESSVGITLEEDPDKPDAPNHVWLVKSDDNVITLNGESIAFKDVQSRFSAMSCPVSVTLYPRAERYLAATRAEFTTNQEAP